MPFGLNSNLFAVLFAGLVALDTVEHNVQAQDDQQDRKDQLQTVGDKDSAPGGLTGGDGSGGSGRDGLDHGNQALHQCGEGDAEHDDKRREQGSVFTAGDFQEDTERDQNECTQHLVCTSEQRPDIGISDTCNGVQTVSASAATVHTRPSTASFHPQIFSLVSLPLDQFHIY